MRKQVKKNVSLAQCVYRLRLCECLHREILSRSSTYCNGSAPETSAGVEVTDMLFLKNALPYLECEEQADKMHKQIEATLVQCQSEVVRSIPPASIAHYMRLAHRQSAQPYRPSRDEMPIAI